MRLPRPCNVLQWMALWWKWFPRRRFSHESPSWTWFLSQMARWNEVRALSLAWHSTAFGWKHPHPHPISTFSYLHISSIPKISGAAPSAERHGPHGPHGWHGSHFPDVPSCQVRDRLASTSICWKLVHSSMTRKPGIFLDGEHEARFEIGSGGTELRGIFWNPLRKVVMLLDAEGGDVVFWMNLSSNVLYCFCVSVLWGRHWQWHSSLLLWQRPLRRYVACLCVEISVGQLHWPECGNGQVMQRSGRWHDEPGNATFCFQVFLLLNILSLHDRS